jgi:hypothetical protein
MCIVETEAELMSTGPIKKVFIYKLMDIKYI